MLKNGIHVSMKINCHEVCKIGFYCNFSKYHQNCQIFMQCISPIFQTKKLLMTKLLSGRKKIYTEKSENV